jgi:hypothetical protein
MSDLTPSSLAPINLPHQLCSHVRNAPHASERHVAVDLLAQQAGRLFAGIVIVRHAPCRHLAEGLRPRRFIQLIGAETRFFSFLLDRPRGLLQAHSL